MTEKLEDILKKGYGVWRKNLNLAIPFVLSAVLGFIVAVVFVVIMGILIVLSMPNFMESSTGLGDINIFGLILLIVTIILMVIVMQLISSFFTAGAIGMAKKALEMKKANLDEMTDYGKRKFMDLFVATMIISLMVILFAILLVGVFIGVPYAIGITTSTPLFVILLISGIVITVVCILALDLIFTPVPYAIVISDLKAIEGIKKGVKFFMDNKMYTFLLWLLIIVISAATSIILNVTQFILEFIPILGAIMSLMLSLLSVLFSLIVVAPLSTVWLSYLYMDRTE